MKFGFRPVMGSLGEINVSVLLDTGSNISCFNSNLKHLSCPIKMDDVLLTSSNTIPVTILGKVIMKIQIQCMPYSYKFSV